jgi:FMN-dependent NADH-azoreductase
MSRLLYIEASPSKRRSHTIGAARAFLSSYAQSHPDDHLETLDLWRADLPPFDDEAIEAKFAVLRRQSFTPAQLETWSGVQRVSRHFNSFDKYLIATPMWNFGIPYVLKHYIDVVTLAGENWSWTPAAGYLPLLSGKKAALIYSSAGDYAIGPSYHESDFQKPYLRRWLNFIGVHDLAEIALAPTLADAARVAAVTADAQARAAELARGF